MARLTYLGLYAFQHRGQESAGVAVSDVFDDVRLDGLSTLAIRRILDHLGLRPPEKLPQP